MADTKISALTDGTTPANTDEFPAARTGANVKLNWLQLKNALATIFVPQTRTVNAQALSGDITLTAASLGLGSVTNDAQTKAAIVPNTAPGAGQLLVGNAGGTAFAPVTASGDVTVSSAGAVTVGAAKITLAKIANAAANAVLLGAGAAGIGAAYSEITLGTNLSMSGTTLNATGGGGGGASVVSAAPAADQNDYAPAGWSTATTLLLTPTTSIVITGFAATSAGDRKVVRNSSSNKAIVFCDEAVTSSTAANRIRMTEGVNAAHIVLLPGESMILEYNSVLSRWMLIETRAGQARWVERNQFGHNNVGTIVGDYPTSSTNGTSSVMYGSATTYADTHSMTGYQAPSSANGLAYVIASQGMFVTSKPVLARNRWSAGFNAAAAPGALSTLFVGMCGGITSMPTAQPSSMLQAAGISRDSSQANLQFMTNDGAGTATMTDLGANYTWVSSRSYDSGVFLDGAGNLAWFIWRLDDLSVVPKCGFASADVPVYTPDAMRPLFGCCTQASGATALLGFHTSSLVTEG